MEVIKIFQRAIQLPTRNEALEDPSFHHTWSNRIDTDTVSCKFRRHMLRHGFQSDFCHRIGRGVNGFDGLPGNNGGDIDDRARLFLRDQKAGNLLGDEEDSAVQVEEIVIVLRRMIKKCLGIKIPAELTSRSMSLCSRASLSMSVRTLAKSDKSAVRADALSSPVMAASCWRAASACLFLSVSDDNYRATFMGNPKTGSFRPMPLIPPTLGVCDLQSSWFASLRSYSWLKTTSTYWLIGILCVQNLSVNSGQHLFISLGVPSKQCSEKYPVMKVMDIVHSKQEKPMTTKAESFPVSGRQESNN